MLKRTILWLALVLCITKAFSQEIPEKSGTLVTDYTNTLSETDKSTLERKLTAYNDSTSTQIAIVIMRSTGDYDINQYGVELLRKWGIGTKEKNNGVLVMVALQDRKMAIQTGYGAEGPLPDIVTQQIIQNDMKPHFQKDDYYGGLDAATDDIIKAMRGEYKGNGRKNGNGGSVGFIVIIVIFILIMIFRKRGGGGGGRIIGSRGGASPFWWFLAGNMLGGGGRSSGSDWGGFSGGGGGWGGGGGGGFGGFGGGSGGGGGSSGSW